MSTGTWKVTDEEKYFKKLNGSDWAEFVNGKKAYSFVFIRSFGDTVILRKTDGSYLKLTPTELQMGCSENNYNRVEYYGSWVKQKQKNSSSRKIMTKSVNLKLFILI